MVVRFDWQVQQDRVTAYTDSDWAGCAKTGRSTSGGIMTLGHHTIKSYSRQQKTVALSSAEAELYAMVIASAETMAIISFAKDIGCILEGEIYADSSAALGIAARQGIGKVRHLRTQSLWVQEVRATGRLSYKKVLGTKNPADVLTKHVPGDLLDRHLETIRAEIVGGRAESAPQLNSVESYVDWYVVVDGVVEAEGEILGEGLDSLMEDVRYDLKQPCATGKHALSDESEKVKSGTMGNCGMQVPSELYSFPVLSSPGERCFQEVSTYIAGDVRFHVTGHLDRQSDVEFSMREASELRDLGDRAKGEPWGIGLRESSYMSCYVSKLK